MIGEIMADQMVAPGSENKKRSLDVAAETQKTKDFVSPPAKKLKQARLPFAPKMSPNSQLTNLPLVESPASKKRKVLTEENRSPILKFGTNKAKKTPTKSPKPNAASNPQAAGKSSSSTCIIDEEEQVPTSSSEVAPPAQKNQSIFKPPPKSNSLDGFLQTTQQPQVSTSECIDLTNESGGEEEDCNNGKEDPRSGLGKEDLEMSSSSEKSLLDSSSNGGERDERSEVTQSCADSAVKTSQDSKSPSSTSLPSGETKVKGSRGKPKSGKTAEKEREKQRLREEKAKLREEKRLKQEAEKKEKEALRKEVQRKRQLEQEEARKEKEAKRKERQARREKEEEEKEEKRKQKQEARQKKQEEIEMIQAEKRKKQEEKQRQEDEKRKEEEEAKKKNQKQQMLFKSFFKKPVPDSTPAPAQYQDCGPFAAFQLRKDMVIAPTIRTKKFLAEDLRKRFDREVTSQSTTCHYLRELSSGSIAIGKSSRTKGSRRSLRDDEQEEKDSDIEEVPTSSSSNLTAKAKLIQFHENYRPPYFGTWRKRSRSICGRKPFAKDEDQLDYDVDSDDEWEDPGESLSDSGTEDEDDNDSDGDESDDGFFVPHGYLSEDEVEGAEDDRETWEKRRAAKAKDWDREMKKKTEALKTFLIGCIWKGAKDTSEKDTKALEQFKAVPLVTMPILLTGVAKSTSPSEKNKHSPDSQNPGSKNMQILAVHNKIRPVPKEAMPDLIRLVHGNIAGIKSLCREFKEFWKRKHTGSSPVVVQKSPVPTKMDATMATGQATETSKLPKEDSENGAAISQTFSPLFRSAEDYEISKRQLEKKISKIAVRDKRDGYSKICWYVHNHILKEFSMEASPVPSTWKFITKKPTDPNKSRTSSPVVTAESSQLQTVVSEPATGKVPVLPNPTPTKGGLLAMLTPLTSPRTVSPLLQGSPSIDQSASATVKTFGINQSPSPTLKSSSINQSASATLKSFGINQSASATLKSFAESSSSAQASGHSMLLLTPRSSPVSTIRHLTPKSTKTSPLEHNTPTGMVVKTISHQPRKLLGTAKVSQVRSPFSIAKRASPVLPTPPTRVLAVMTPEPTPEKQKVVPSRVSTEAVISGGALTPDPVRGKQTVVGSPTVSTDTITSYRVISPDPAPKKQKLITTSISKGVVISKTSPGEAITERAVPIFASSISTDLVMSNRVSPLRQSVHVPVGMSTHVATSSERASSSLDPPEKVVPISVFTAEMVKDGVVGIAQQKEVTSSIPTDMKKNSRAQGDVEDCIIIE